jgi:hypothetical protein
MLSLIILNKEKLILICSLILYGCYTDYHYSRNYKLNDTYSYKLTTFSQRGNSKQTKSVAFSKHTIINNSNGIPSERIEWTKYVNEDSDITTDSVIQRIQPYEISLHPKGSVDLPAIFDPSVTGIVTDLNTFLVCLSAHTGIDKLSKIGDTYTDPETLVGDFSDSQSILFGKDCLELTHALLAIKNDTVIFESKFLPPKNDKCGQIAYNNKVEFEDGENFNMIRKSGKDEILFFKGVEDFSIISKVNKQSGKLLYAEMTNNLYLKMKLNCTSDLDSCSQEYPFNIKRKVILELLNKN